MIKIKDKYLQDFLKFVQYRDGIKIQTDTHNGRWNIFWIGNLIGIFNPSSNEIQIFGNEMMYIIIDYFQLGFGHDVFDTSL